MRNKLFAAPVELLSAKNEDGSFVVPTEFRLFKLGLTKTLKGDYTLDAPTAQKRIDDFAEYGNALAIDYEHSTFFENGQPAPAAGFIPQGGLQLRADGLYAVGVDWNAAARTMLAAGEYRYFSPAFIRDYTGKTVGVIAPPALVNWPATMGMSPLVFGGGDRMREAAKDKRTTKLTAFCDIGDAVTAALTVRFGQCWIVDLEDDSVTFEFGGKLMQIAYSVDDSGLVALGDQANEVERAYVPVESGLTIMKSLLVRLGLNADAAEAVALSAIGNLKDLERDVLRLSGKPSVAEALGHLEGIAVKAGAYDRLAAEVSAKEATDKAVAVEAVYSAARLAGKTTVASEKAHRAMTEHPDPTKLAAYFDALPVLIAPPITLGGKSKTDETVKPYEELSRGEKHRLANDDPEAYAALKKDFDRRTKAVRLP